ncbi:MAG: ATP-dependent DNA helicase [Bacillota bacterium]|nr:ATP-dependent DNA helicase [Bacillota bacterium]
MEYTKEQLEAINTIDCNLQIIACAGSGKTQVVAARVVEILRRKGPDGIAPRNIVAFTFTERAAAELKDRIVRLCSEQLGEVPGLAEMYVGTIHGFCLQLLQTHIYKYLKYSVLTDIQARLFVDRHSKQSGLSELGLQRYLESGLYLDVLSVVREAQIVPAVLDAHPVKRGLEMYQDLLDSKAYLDYSEILSRAVVELLENEALRQYVAEQVKYLTVDEYQDVNPLQELLISELNRLGANLCVVGDDDQTIYQWRGSDVQNILTFAERYPDVHVVRLEKNFRSSKGVVECARTVIEENNPDRLKKRMVSADSQPFDRGDVLALEFPSPEEEAGWIAQKIAALHGRPFQDEPGKEPRGLAWSDCAVLLRSVRHNGEPIINALRAAGIPVIVVGMNNLFGTQEAQAARAIFAYLVDEANAQEVVERWSAADLGLSAADLKAGLAFLDDHRPGRAGTRWASYNLQRVYLGFLEAIGFREDRIPGRPERAEVVAYNLGKFSQVISDYEQIHFHADPEQKYQGFAKFLQYQAPDYYPEGWQEASYARPDAVQVMTIHQAKGMEWPVVFVPCLLRNRFPAKRPGGKNRWHVIPREAVAGADRYDGSVEDERRLLYVALTRSQKYLFCSWAPQAGNQLFQKPSQFLSEITRYPEVLTREPKRPEPPHLPAKQKAKVANVTLNFSELKYFFECPYQFKLRFLYGFNPPLHEALGFGKSLHDALAEIHRRAVRGEIISLSEVPDIVARHLHLPFAYPELKEKLQASGIQAVERYVRVNGAHLEKAEHVEQVIEINLGDGVLVNGRIDLIRRTDTGEVMIVDFKSTERAQAEDVTRQQLHVYAMGYRELTGRSADLIEVHNLDEGRTVREEVDEALESNVRVAIKEAGAAIQANRMERRKTWCKECGECDLVGICRQRPEV